MSAEGKTPRSEVSLCSMISVMEASSTSRPMSTALTELLSSSSAQDDAAETRVVHGSGRGEEYAASAVLVLGETGAIEVRCLTRRNSASASAWKRG